LPSQVGVLSVKKDPMFRYKAFSEEIKQVFGQRVDRITLNVGMTCPNVDGTKAKGGCTFCQDVSYLGASFKGRDSLYEQYTKALAYLEGRYPSEIYFAYFQNGTNTYAPLSTLRSYYEEVITYPKIKGLFISTRPDCINDEIVSLLSELNQKTYLWIEMGVQSHRNDRLQQINRAHTIEEFEEALQLLNQAKINVCAHVMIGLPGETREENIEKALYFSRQPICGLKIHNTVVFKGTPLQKQYDQKMYEPLTLEEYTHQCVDFIEHLRPDITIARLNAHGPRHLTIAPLWSVNKMATMNAIHDELERRETWQGKKL